MTYRCFFALDAPEPLRATLVQRLKDFASIPGVNWVKPETLHLTLLFLGDVDVNLVPALKALSLETAQAWKALPLAAKGIELFPAREPRLVWVSLRSEDNAIFDLHKELVKQTRELGIEADPKPLKLHITLGRIKRQIQPQLERSILESGVDTQMLPYEQLSLYRSQLKPEGPVYNILEQSILQ